MVETIGNPLSWIARHLLQAGEYVEEATEDLAPHDDFNTLRVATLTHADLVDSLRLGYADFAAARTDVMALCVVYPVIGGMLAYMGLHTSQVHLLFPMIAGFALLGPLATVVLYEISLRREAGESVSWGAAFSVLGSPRFGPIFVLGLYHIALFVGWLVLAQGLYSVTLGPEQPASLVGFAHDIFTTPAGWTLIAVGGAFGAVFALAVLATSAVSYPALLDREIGLVGAVALSLRVFRANPRIMLQWGAIVAGALVLGTIPALLGLVVALPILGHATWHLYRKAVR